MDAIEAIMTRRSVRSFTGEAVGEDDITIILRAAMAAPSAVNVQPWAFVVVTDKEILTRLCDGLPYAKMLDKAGAAIIVCGLPEKDKVYAKDYWMVDCAAATQNILLAAHALGYGAVWTAAWADADRVKFVRGVCKIPQNAIPLNVIPLGVPVDGKPATRDRFDPGIIHRNSW